MVISHEGGTKTMDCSVGEPVLRLSDPKMIRDPEGIFFYRGTPDKNPKGPSEETASKLDRTFKSSK